jgi:hypothetical protein
LGTISGDFIVAPSDLPQYAGTLAIGAPPAIGLEIN